MSEDEGIHEDGSGDEEDFDGISEEEAEGLIFQTGQDILITMADEGEVSVGAFIGLSEFGVIYRATYRMMLVQDRTNVETRNKFMASLWIHTIAELKEIAANEEISLMGLKKKGEIIAELADSMVAMADSMMEPHKALVPLKRSVMTFLPWHKVDMIERADEYMEERDLAAFSESLEQFMGVDLVAADATLSDEGAKDE
jgi:hypothetical protein